MSQYQHYVPQLILRKYSDFVRPQREDYASKKEFDKALSKAKDKARVDILDFKDGITNDLTKSELRRSKCSKTFGMDDMYDEEIEDALSKKLEQPVSKIIDSIEKDLLDGKTATVIARPQKDLLRKFIFIMAYRNRKFHQRFGGEEDDYDSNDRAELLAYMHEKGFTKPKDVWLNNIRAFIEVDLQQEEECWTSRLMDRAYPGDALWFWKNMTTSYLCFCTPKNPYEEFFLTQNAYGIFEGPCDHRSWTDWHTFAPINHRLVVVSRSQFLGGIPNIPSTWAMAFTQVQSTAVRALTSRYEDPAQAHSWLADLPVSRPIPSYLTPDSFLNHQLSPRDTFTFKFFALPSRLLQRVNAIFLEEAIATDAIVYKSRTALRKAIEAYLRLEKPGFKVAVKKPEGDGPEIWRLDYTGVNKMSHPPEYHRQAYLQMLERIARGLGSKCMVKVSFTTPRQVLLIPPFTPTFIARYRKLGFDNSPTTWLVDEQQARLIGQLWLLTNEVGRSMDKHIWNAVQKERLKLVSDLHPRRVWLYLRLMRVLTDRPLSISSASRDAFLHNLVADDNGGPEDVVVDCMSAFEPGRVSRAMLRASGMRQYSEIRTVKGQSTSEEQYFMAALTYTGSLTDCDLPRLREAANKFGMEPNPLVISAVAAKLGCPERLAHEMWMRNRVHRNFASLLRGSGLKGEILQRLNDFLFQLLYPSHWTDGN